MYIYVYIYIYIWFGQQSSVPGGGVASRFTNQLRFVKRTAANGMPTCKSARRIAPCSTKIGISLPNNQR